MDDDTQPLAKGAEAIEENEDLEISAEDSDAIKGGEGVSFKFGGIQVQYTQQGSDGAKP